MMRAHFIAAASIAALTIALPGEARPAVWEAGLKAGLNIAGFRGEFADFSGAETKLGFVGGGFVAYPLRSGLALQGELLYSMKGAKLEIQGTDVNGNPVNTFTYSWTLHYLEVPLLVRASLGSTWRVRPELSAGPTLGFKLSGRYEPAPGDSHNLDDVKPVDVGFTAGVGAVMGSGQLKYRVEARYTSGFSSIYDVSGNIESINQAFSIMVGVAR